MLILTDVAQAKIAEILSGDQGVMFRVSIKQGGCAGNQYAFTTDTSQNPSDIIIKQAQFDVIINELDLKKINGSTIDFIDELQGSYFSVDNPNIAQTCNCGGSFSI